MASTHPNGLWIWRLAKIRTDYMQVLQQLGCRRVYLKVFDDLHDPPAFWKFQCTPALIQEFNKAGIEVYGWGYHFDQRTTINVPGEIQAVTDAIKCGLAGYILDVEVEVKDPSTHPQLKQLLQGLRAANPGIPLGYTSFGHPGKHSAVPWKLLDDQCDLAFPQIYFEKFTFGSTEEEEVQACLDAHAKLKLKKPILPLWGSEEDTQNPATAAVLQQYLNRFPGSSIFRAPNIGQQGEAWNLRYDGGNPIFFSRPRPADFKLGDFPGTLTAAHITSVQRALAANGFDPGPFDGMLGPRTIKAIKSFQLKAGLSPDGAIGPVTWGALGGNVPQNVTFASDIRTRLAAFAEVEAGLALRWTGPTSEAEKYLKPLRKPMQDLGHIGSAPVFYDWCAAFVTYCCRQTGLTIPDQPPGFWATMALVESWKFWAKQNGWWLGGNNIAPERGDIVCFEWNDGDASADHIGIVRGYTPNSTTFLTSEGNRGNRSGNFSDRLIANIAGLIRLR